MNAIHGSELERRHGEIHTKANEVVDKHKHTILRRVIRALPYGLEIGIIAIALPILVTRLTGWNVLWACLAVIPVAVLIRLIREDYQLRARIWWAEKTRALYDDVLKIAEKNDALDCAFQRGEERLQAIAAALHTLEDVLRTDILEICESQTVQEASEKIEVRISVTAEAIRNDLRNLCKFICEILTGQNQNHLRCGILIEDPKDSNSLIPVVVYDPTDPTYVSSSRFTDKDFSGQLLRHFKSKLGQRDWKKFATYVISDVDNVDLSTTHFGHTPITPRSHQEYLKSIAGNVIFCRNRENEILVLGVINIDSNRSGAIRESDYRALQPYLFPAFRLFASRLLLMKNQPELAHVIWHDSK